MKEYELLRAEILEDYTHINQYENLLYTVVAAILVFSLQSNWYLLCLIPYVVILPVFLIVMGIKSGICKIATYMQAFLEGADFNWETRHAYFDKTYIPGKQGALKWRTHSQYYLLSAICSLAAIYKILVSNYSVVGVCVRAIAVSIFTAFVFIVIFRNTLDYGKTKEKMLRHWRKVKEEMKSSGNNG